MEVCYCDNDAKWRCSRCHNAYYCSQECQISDWELEHKTNCKLIESSHQNLEFSKFDWFNAAQNDETQKMLKMLKFKNANINVQDEDGWTALMFASRGNKVKWVKKLIKLGSDVNIQNYENDTSLLIAALWGHYKVVKVLIKAHADLYIENDKKYSALMVAIENSDSTSNLKTVRVLLETIGPKSYAYDLCPDDLCRAVFKIVQYRDFLNPYSIHFSQTTNVLKKLENRLPGSKLFAKRFMKTLDTKIVISPGLSRKQMVMKRFENQQWDWPNI